MNDNSSKITEAFLLTKKVNHIGKKLLKNNQNYIMHSNFFSIVLISDTHSNQLNENKENSSLQKYCLLLKKIKLYDDILCIVHGGDVIQGVSNNSKKSKAQLEYFITSTQFELYDKVEPIKMIPFIMNTGNHEYYCKDKKDTFNKLVDENSDLIKVKRHLLDIILLDTGYTHNGFVDINSFKRQINFIDKKIQKEHKDVQFLLDMHIPPKLGYFSKYSKHTLNSQLTDEFVRFINKYQNRIIAISTHHIHNFHSKDSSIPIYIHSEGNIPIYLTTSGGHKNSKNEYSCLKMNFQMIGDIVQLKNMEEIKNW